jgi:hypothetical protein
MGNVCGYTRSQERYAKIGSIKMEKVRFMRANMIKQPNSKAGRSKVLWTMFWAQ